MTVTIEADAGSLRVREGKLALDPATGETHLEATVLLKGLTVSAKQWEALGKLLKTPVTVTIEQVEGGV